MLGKPRVGAECLGKPGKLSSEQVGLEAVIQTGQPAVPGLGRVGMLLQDSAKHLDSLLGLAVVNQSQSHGHSQGKVPGILLPDRLEDLHLRAGSDLVDIDPGHFQKQPHLVAGVGFALVQPHAQLVGFLGPSFEVQQVKQRPARLRNHGVEFQCFFPAALGQDIALLLVMGLTLRETHHGSFLGGAGMDLPEVIQGTLRLWIRPVQGELRHEQVGAIVAGKYPEITSHEILGPIELMLPRQGADLVQVRRRPGPAPECHSASAHQGEQACRNEPGWTTKSRIHRHHLARFKADRSR